jgi:hypothetical protein
MPGGAGLKGPADAVAAPDFGEPDLDPVQPARIRQREVEVYSWILLEEIADHRHLGIDRFGQSRHSSGHYTASNPAEFERLWR